MTTPAPPVIEMVATETLIPYARNSRTHSDEQVAQIMASIKEFGFTNPILIDEATTMIAGHGRVMAATRMKIDEVPCVRLSHLTDAQKKAYVIADNKLALNADWDFEMLTIELKDLKLADFDLSYLGFADYELDPLLAADWKPPEVDAMPSRDGESHKLEFTSEQWEQVSSVLEVYRSEFDTADASDGECCTEIICRTQQ